MSMAECEFDYLFKGNWNVCLFWKNVHSFCFSMHLWCHHTAWFDAMLLLLFSCVDRWFYGRENEFVIPFLSRRVQSELQINHRCRICYNKYPNGWKNNQGSDLGHRFDSKSLLSDIYLRTFNIVWVYVLQLGKRNIKPSLVRAYNFSSCWTSIVVCTVTILILMGFGSPLVANRSLLFISTIIFWVAC